MKKRLVSLLLIAVLLFSLLPVSVFAENVTSKGETTLTYINPRFDGIIDPAVTAQRLNEKVQSEGFRLPQSVDELCFTYEELVLAMRSDMSKHYPEFTLYFVPEKSARINDNYLDSLFNQMIYDAEAETGNPIEGDYISWSYDGIYANTQLVNYDEKRVLILSFEVLFFTTPEQEIELNKEIVRVIETLNIVPNASEYTKIKKIYDYICANIDYVVDGTLMQYSAYNALMKKGAVCQGYATLLYNMMLRVGVGCRVITSIDHAWNIVRIDDLYYNVDSTWDAGYRPSQYEWFLLCQRNFVDHPREDYCKTAEFNAAYPMSPSDYLDANGHHWINPVTVKEANCTENGEIKYTCEICGVSVRQTVKALGHNFKNPVTVKEATCTESGQVRYTCTRCPQTQIQTVKALGHHYVGNTCSRCGDVRENGGLNLNFLSQFFSSITSFFSNLFSSIFSIFRF